MHHYYDLLMCILARQSNLSEGVQIAYMNPQEEKSQLPTHQRMFQSKSHQE